MQIKNDSNNEFREERSYLDNRYFHKQLIINRLERLRENFSQFKKNLVYRQKKFILVKNQEKTHILDKESSKIIAL